MSQELQSSSTKKNVKAIISKDNISTHKDFLKLKT
jgi:hypothetical protein